MGRHKLWHFEPKLVRDTIHKACELADRLHDAEQELVKQLALIDKKRFFVRLGYRSLRTFCIHHLRFTRVQAQRIATQVRHLQSTFDNGHDGVYPLQPY